MSEPVLSIGYQTNSAFDSILCIPVFAKPFTRFHSTYITLNGYFGCYVCVMSSKPFKVLEIHQVSSLSILYACFY